ncbi:MAG: tryptophan-rich sensory protein [Candidatus Coatesbacteria bacterium]|nr:MAG: tryptophan-rich sensory protein [Candidatus Coatesbacteria bacterium]
MKKALVVDASKLVLSILACQAAGFIGGLLTAPNIETWYAYVEKPPFTPPDWVFSPVWISLYLLMGLSGYLVWRKGLDKSAVRKAMGVYVIQLVLNPVWSLAFFGFHSPLAGFVVIVILWFTIILTIFYFSRVSRTAGFLLVPYILWVSFASILNFSIFILNL